MARKAGNMKRYRWALILSILVSTCATSQLIPVGGIGITGLSQFGSPGLFFNPSALILGSGQLSIGITYSGGVGDARRAAEFPIALNFGLVDRMEASISSSPMNTPTSEEKHSTLGVRGLLLRSSSDASAMALDIGFHRIEFPVLVTGETEALGASARVVGTVQLGTQLTASANAGYMWLKERIPGAKNRFVGGVGISGSIGSLVIVGIEGYSEPRLFVSGGFGAKIGWKAFILQHIQWSTGAEISKLEGKMSGGVFLGLSFSSEVLQLSGPEVERPNLLPEPPPFEELTPQAEKKEE